jgi:hypothetical protein
MLAVFQNILYTARMHAETATNGRVDGPSSARPTKSNEDKHADFKRLAEKRTNAILEKIRVLSNCANPYVYEWTDEDIRQIFSTLDQELKLARARFQRAQPNKRQFKLK